MEYSINIIYSLSRTLVPSSPVLVELQPWRGQALRDVICSQNFDGMLSTCFQRIKGETISQATGDGDKDTFKMDAGLCFLTLSTTSAFHPPSGAGCRLARLFG